MADFAYSPPPSPSPSPPTQVPAADSKKINYLDLPCPIPYEDVHREALHSLKPEIFEGLRFGANYVQSVSPHLSLGAEVFWAGRQRKSGVGYAARYNTDKMVATGQVASTGMVALSYVQKLSEKVSLASDFMHNYISRDVTASVGYDYILRQCRLRGKIDSNGCAAAYLEERLFPGATFILSAEINHPKKDYKFGFGLTIG